MTVNTREIGLEDDCHMVVEDDLRRRRLNLLEDEAMRKDGKIMTEAKDQKNRN
jgi:hypothetical protein